MAAISEAEMLRRHSVMESVIGTSAMEGQHADAATLAIMIRYENGDLTLDEFSAEMDAYAQSLIRMLAPQAVVA